MCTCVRNRKTPDCAVELAGFSLVQVDRDEQNGRSLDGVLDVFVNDKWFNQGHAPLVLNFWLWV